MSQPSHTPLNPPPHPLTPALTNLDLALLDGRHDELLHLGEVQLEALQQRAQVGHAHRVVHAAQLLEAAQHQQPLQPGDVRRELGVRAQKDQRGEEGGDELQRGKVLLHALVQPAQLRQHLGGWASG